MSGGRDAPAWPHRPLPRGRKTGRPRPCGGRRRCGGHRGGRPPGDRPHGVRPCGSRPHGRGGVAAGHTRDPAAPGKSAEGRVSCVAGDDRARGGSVLGGCMGAPGARRRVLNLKDRTKVATRTAAKFISPFFSPSSCTYCILPHPFPVSALAAPVSLSVSAGIIVRLNPAAPSPAAWPLSWDAGALPRQLRPSTACNTPPRPRPTRPRLHHPPSRLAAHTACSALIPGHTGTPPPLVVHSSLPDPLLVPSWPLATPPRPAALPSRPSLLPTQ